MAFTAGSVQLARAQKLGKQLGNIFASHGITGVRALLEKKARNFHFGITGLTTGAGFPAFGSLGGVTGVNLNVAAVLQNPNGLTTPNGITVSQTFVGQTVGIYHPAIVRDGSDKTVTNSSVGAVAGTTSESFSVTQGLTATIYFAGGTYSVA
jgi:hypothetical protein